MRRLVCCVLILALIPVMIVPAAAADTDEDSNWVDVLDFVYIWGGVSNSGNVGANGSFYIPVSNSDTRRIYEIDMIMQMDGVIPTAITFKGPTTVTPHIYDLGDGLYRLRASVDWGHAGGFSVVFESSGATKVYVKKCDILGIPVDHYPDLGVLQVSDGDGVTKLEMSTPAGYVTYNFYQDAGVTQSGFGVSLYMPEWQKYDYIEFVIRASVGEINSVEAVSGIYGLPFTSGYIDSGTADSDYIYTVFKIDVSELSVDAGTPTLQLHGWHNASEQDYIRLYRCTGYVEVESENPVRMWIRESWTQVTTSISNLGTSLMSGLGQLNDSIQALPERIAEELSKLYTPSEGKIERMLQDSDQLASDRLGAVYQAGEVVSNLASSFQVYAATETLTVPVLTVPLAGVDFTIGGWDVDVVPAGFEPIIDALKLVVDIVCTLKVLDAMKRRFEGVLTK